MRIRTTARIFSVETIEEIANTIADSISYREVLKNRPILENSI